MEVKRDRIVLLQNRVTIRLSGASQSAGDLARVRLQEGALRHRVPTLVEVHVHLLLMIEGLEL